MNTAQQLRQEIGSAVAWTMPVYFLARVTRKTGNRYGVTYRFDDGSKAFVPAGTSLICVED